MGSYPDINPFVIVESRELSRSSDIILFLGNGISGINQALSYEGPVLIVAHGGIHWATCCFKGINNYDWTIANCLPMHFSLTAGFLDCTKALMMNSAKHV